MKISGNVLNGTRNKGLDFGRDLDHCLDHLDPGFFKRSYNQIILGWILVSPGIELTWRRSALSECSC